MTTDETAAAGSAGTSAAHGKREHWGSQVGAVLAAAGSAVGLGNIWRFPYLAGENGGGAFVLIYLGLVFTIGLSILIAELAIGRLAQANAVTAFRRLGTPGWRVIGWMGVGSALIILSFYSIVAGWTVAYAAKMAGGTFMQPGTRAAGVFDTFAAQPLTPLLFGAGVMTVTALVILRGVARGIERLSLVLMPLLLVLLAALMLRALTLPGALDGLAFLVAPDFGDVSFATVNAALGQAFFSLSLGLGAMLTYGSYMKREHNVARSAGAIVALDSGIAIAAGTVVLPAVFAFGLEPGAGPGLVFVTLPEVFGQMVAGQVFGTLFFVLLAFAALTSMLALMEPVCAFLMGDRGLSRRTATVLTAVVAFVLGIPSSWSMGMWSDVTLFGMTIFGIADYVTAKVMLPLGGLLIALFAGWILGPRIVAALDPETRAPMLVRGWLWVTRVIAPAAIAWILVSGVLEG
jgi:NSS family neurotransmitter:Na+ symporter